jgi:hypothetical protein
MATGDESVRVLAKPDPAGAGMDEVENDRV